MPMYLTHQPTDIDGEVDSPWVWTIYKNPFAGPPKVETFELTDQEMKDIIRDYHTILESEAEDE